MAEQCDLPRDPDIGDLIEQHRCNYVNNEFEKHSEMSRKVKEKIEERRKQAMDIWDVWEQKFKELPKWLRIIIIIFNAAFLIPLMFIALNGWIKMGWYENAQIMVAVGIALGIWALMKYVFII